MGSHSQSAAVGCVGKFVLRSDTRANPTRGVGAAFSRVWWVTTPSRFIHHLNVTCLFVIFGVGDMARFCTTELHGAIRTHCARATEI
jgi:hypothetical protein